MITKKGGLKDRPFGTSLSMNTLSYFFRTNKFYPFFSRIHGHLSAVLEVELFHDVTQVIFYRVL